MCETCTRGQEGKSVTTITIPIKMREKGGDTYQGEERRRQKWDSWDDKMAGIRGAIQRIRQEILKDTTVETCFSREQNARMQVHCPLTNGTEMNGIKDPNEIRQKIIEITLKQAIQKKQKYYNLLRIQTQLSGLN